MAGITVHREIGRAESSPGVAEAFSPESSRPAAGAWSHKTPITRDIADRYSGRSRPGCSGEQILTNACIVGPETTFRGTVHVMGGRIVAVDTTRSYARSAVDLQGDYLLPGLIDVHTDNLERHLQPRPGVDWPSLPALIAHDRQMAAAGITTVFDSLCVGDRHSGHASKQGVLLDSLRAMERAQSEGLLKSEHFLHLRCEVSSAGAVPAFAALVDDPCVRLVSLMDHTPGQRQWSDVVRWRQANHGGMSEDELDAVWQERTLAGRELAAAARREIAQICRQRHLALASHDDGTAEHVHEAAAVGVTIAEFPTTELAARAAHAAGMHVVMGAPNVVLGGSHSGNVSARELAALGLIDGLASDYVPTSLIQACFVFYERLGMNLATAVAAITATPAAMLGLEDRGAIVPGRRADLLHVKAYEHMPIIAAVWRDGVHVG